MNSNLNNSKIIEKISTNNNHRNNQKDDLFKDKNENYYRFLKY